MALVLPKSGKRHVGEYNADGASARFTFDLKMGRAVTSDYSGLRCPAWTLVEIYRIEASSFGSSEETIMASDC